MKTPLLALPAFLLLSACAGSHFSASGVQTVPDAGSAMLKTAAVNGARAEIALNTDNAGLRRGIYLDTLVGPTPPGALYEEAHPHAWLETMVSSHKVDGLFGVPARRTELPATAFAIAVGEPYPAGRDTLEIVYAWCVRSFASGRSHAATPSVWRDLFTQSDTGWIRVGHLPAVAPTACSN